MTTLGEAAPEGRGDNGKYQRIAMIGQGGMAHVWLVTPRLGAARPQFFALKELRAGLGEDPEFVAMFLREAKLAARLEHPHVVRTYGVELEGELPYLVMEYLEGQPLHTVLGRLGRKGGLPLPLHAYVLAKTLEALDYLHDFRDEGGRPLGIVHRDVSPHNVFVTYDGQVKLMDFGIVKFAEGSQTQIGVIKGKVGYMAPEQLLGRPLDRRADVFSVGVMLWEALVGRRLTAGENAPAIFSKRVQGQQEPVLVAAPDAPPELAAIADRAMALSPDDRYATAGEMAAALEAWLASRSVTSAELSRAVAAAFAEQRQRVRELIAQQTNVLRAGLTPSAVLRLGGGGEAAGATGVTGSSGSLSRSAPAVELSVAPREPKFDAPFLAPASALGPRPRSAREKLAVAAGTWAAAVVVAGLAMRGLSSPPPAPGAAPALAPAVDRPLAVGPGAADPAAAAPAQPGAAADDEVQREVDLVVWAQPEGGRVFIDGESVGATPLSLRLAQDAASHVLRVSAPGFRDEERVVTFGRDLNIEISLKPLARSAPSAKPGHESDRGRRGGRPPRTIDDGDPYR